ncbi:MAG: murein biosynthesis integral membrane protein MurJ [Deltaproteobacteria bacterium]
MLSTNIVKVNSHRSEKENVSRAAGTVGFYTLLSRILGLVRDMVLAYFFGSKMAADAFFVAFRIPNLLRRFFAEGSLTIAFIPVFTETLTRKSKEDAFELARAVLTLLSLLLVVLTVLGVLLSPWIVRIQAYGFGASGPKYELTVLLTRITFPYILLVSLVAFFMGVLNSLRHFAAPAASPILLNLGIIAGALCIAPYLPEPIVGVALGVLIGGILQVLLQLPWIAKNGLSLRPLWRPEHPAVKKIGLLMLPAIFGSAVYQLNQFIGTLLASFLPQGSISWLYYADRIVEFPLGVFAIAISTAALPSLAKQVAGKDVSEFRETLGHALRLVFFITTPAAVGMIILRVPIIEVFFQRGAFDRMTTLMTAEALMFYSLGLWAFSASRVMLSAFYAFQDTRTPVQVATVTMIVNALLSFALMGPLRHGGLALSLSLSSTVQLLLLILILRRRGELLDLRSMVSSAGRSLAASAVMGLALYDLNRRWLSGGEPAGLWTVALALAGVISAGVVVYFLAAWIFRCREVSSMMRMFRTVVSKTRN